MPASIRPLQSVNAPFRKHTLRFLEKYQTTQSPIPWFIVNLARKRSNSSAWKPALYDEPQKSSHSSFRPSRSRFFNSRSYDHVSCHTATQRNMSSKKSTTNDGGDNFSYNLAAAYSGKKNKFDMDRHYFSYNTEMSQQSSARMHVEEIGGKHGNFASGQDACFISPVGKSKAVAFGVADGVGGWQDQGIDSAAFAHGICKYMEALASRHQGNGSLHPGSLLQSGYNRVCSDETIVGGGSTACIAVASSTGNMTVANLGDSGFMQLRLKKVHYYSDPQTHAFNTPYQLSRIPPKILAQIEIFGGGAPFSDMPSDASITSHQMQHGDVMVFATDGVWDNLSSQDILRLVCNRMDDLQLWIDNPDGPRIGDSLGQLTETNVPGTEKSLQVLMATDIVQAAKAAGRDGRRDGPFAKAFQRAFPHDGYHGGKPDDIAVIVVIVTSKSEPSWTKSKL